MSGEEYPSTNAAYWKRQCKKQEALAYNKKGYLYGDCLEQVDDKIVELKAQLARCVVQRDEAMEWNWMDGDVPEEVALACRADTEESAHLDAAILKAAENIPAILTDTDDILCVRDIQHWPLGDIAIMDKFLNVVRAKKEAQ